jgi:hypothetical protein
LCPTLGHHWLFGMHETLPRTLLARHLFVFA